MRSKLPSLLALVVCACASTQGVIATLPAHDGAIRTEVTRIVDGDTLYVADLEERIRLIGIDTPELIPQPGCYGAEASARLTSLIPPGTKVLVVFDLERYDRYERNLAYIYTLDDSELVNVQMVEEGYARLYTFPPNTAHLDALEDAERRARDGGLGLWGAC